MYEGAQHEQAENEEQSPEQKAASELARQQAIKKKWMDRVEAYKKRTTDYDGDCKNAIKCFGLNRKPDDEKARYDIGWANREILRASIYEHLPTPVVKRRYAHMNPASRTASTIMERVTGTLMSTCHMDEALSHARDELVDFSRGTVWLRYEAEWGDPLMVTDETGQQVPATDEVGEPIREIQAEKVYVDFVPRELFGHSEARTWSQVKQVWRGTWMTKGEIKERFGDQMAKRVATGQGEDQNQEGRPDGTVLVYEGWCKVKREVVFFCNECDIPLEVSKPFLDLSGFFPCPKPAFGTTRSKSLTPIPDTVFYKSQLEQINKLTMRIDALSDALKVRGFYPAGASDDGADAIEAAIKSLDDRNVMIPLEGWAAFADKKDLGIVWLPVDTVMKVIAECIRVRQQLIEDIYQIVGLSDIMRGDAKASETATAQSIKDKWGSMRLRNKQRSFEGFARDCIAIMAEIVAENFQDKTILEMAQVTDLKPEDVQAAMALMRDDRMRGFMIEVETDSTISRDDAAEKESRNEFAQVIANTLTQAMPIVQQAPEMARLVGETIKFVARGYRAGRELEDVIEETIDQITQKMEQAAMQPPQPDPEAEAKARETEANAKLKGAQTVKTIEEAKQIAATPAVVPFAPPAMPGGQM